jgi:SpoVK/Ycf46/Vps4 family AAA+-type ATPase
MAMELTDAINHLKESLADPTHKWGCEECKEEHEQLLVWLESYKNISESFPEVRKKIDRLEEENMRLLRSALKSAKRCETLEAEIKRLQDVSNSCQICGNRISPYKQVCHKCEVKYNIMWGDSITQKLQEYIQNLERGEKLTLDEVIQLIKQALEKVSPDKHTEFRFTVGQVKQLLGWMEDYKQLKTDYIDIDKQFQTANTENGELKRMLRLALESFDFISDKLIPYTESMCVCDFAMMRANPFDNCFNCPLSNAKHKYCKWRHHDEAMELLGGTENA